MQIETFYPEHPLLKEYIEYYYFQKTGSDNSSNEYYAFPNTREIDAHRVKSGSH